MVVICFIKSQWAKKRNFIHFQVEVFENIISKNNFKGSDGSEYVSNMSHMIKIIILDGTEPFGCLSEGL